MTEHLVDDAVGEHDHLCNAATELERWLEKYRGSAFAPSRKGVRAAIQQIDRAIRQIEL